MWLLRWRNAGWGLGLSAFLCLKLRLDLIAVQTCERYVQVRQAFSLRAQ